MKINSLRIFLLTAIACFSFITSQAHDFEANGIYYQITNQETKEVEITFQGAYYDEYTNRYSGVVNIPSSVTYNGNTYSVTSIGDEAFYGCSGLTSVTIPNSVTRIGSYAFRGCSGLTSVGFNAENCTRMGSSSSPAFYGCTALSSVIIGENVKNIPDYAFFGCSGLTSITIPNSVTSIGVHAFCICSGLTSITIPNSVTSIGDSAFWGCSGLTNVTIPNSVTSIGSFAFYDCSALTSVTIPNSVTTIGGAVFHGCSALTSVTIPNSVISIGNLAFYNCSALTSVTSMNPIPPTCGSYVFYGVDTNTCKLYVPEGSKEVYSTADHWKDFMDIIDNLAGIEDVIADEDADAPVEYFNLNGVRVDNPQNGIYIKRQGKKIEKVIIK